jgi:hypothetical protein
VKAAMYLKNIFNEIHQTAEAPTTSLFFFQFCLRGKVLQAELRRALAEGSFTQLLELKTFLVGPNFQSSQNISIIVRRYLQSSSEIYIIDNSSIGQHISLIYKVGQKYHNFNLGRNYKDFKLWVTEKLLMIKLKIRDNSINNLDNFKDIYRKINQLRNFEKDILESNIRIKTSSQLEFMKKLVDLEDSSLDKIDNIIIEFPTVERLLEGVIKYFYNICQYMELCTS